MCVGVLYCDLRYRLTYFLPDESRDYNETRDYNNNIFIILAIMYNKINIM